MGDRQFLLTLRVMLVAFTLAALLFALNSKQTMYDMVQNAYTVTLVAALVPLAAGIFWKRANNAGAILSALFGLAGWADRRVGWRPRRRVPPPLVGLAFSIFGMVLGAFAPARRALQHAQPHGGHAEARRARRSPALARIAVRGLRRCSSPTPRSIRWKAGATTGCRRSTTSRSPWPRYVTALRRRGQRARLCALRLPLRARRCIRGFAGVAAFAAALAQRGAPVARARGGAELPADALRHRTSTCCATSPARAVGAALAALRSRRRCCARPAAAACARGCSCPGADIDAGLALLALWLFTQLNPATLLFGAGDLRDLLVAGAGRARAPEFFVAIEAFIAAANLVSVALLLSALVRAGAARCARCSRRSSSRRSSSRRRRSPSSCAPSDVVRLAHAGRAVRPGRAASPSRSPRWRCRACCASRLPRCSSWRPPCSSTSRRPTPISPPRSSSGSRAISSTSTA